MKNSYQPFSVAIIAAVFLFSSCSRELTSIPNANKLANAQTLEKQKVPVQKTEPMALIQAPTPQLLPPTEVAPSTSVQPIKLAQSHKLIRHSIASILPKQASKVILKQANTLRHLGSDNQVASLSGTNHTESWLGLAIVCLIVGILLAVLGFADLGAVFWAIGIVILVVAIIFFILWLLAEAVEG